MKLPLSSPVTLTKWMRRIQLAEIVRSPIGKPVTAQASKIIAGRESCKNLLQRRHPGRCIDELPSDVRVEDSRNKGFDQFSDAPMRTSGFKRSSCSGSVRLRR